MAPTDPRVETIRLLTSIDAKIGAVLELAGILVNRTQPASTAVPDRVLDGPHGDPEVKAKDPRDWAGEPMKGRRFSECPPDYLDLVAERLEYFNQAETDEKKRHYNTLDAQRARGWAARLRAGYTPPVRETAPQGEPEW